MMYSIPKTKLQAFFVNYNKAAVLAAAAVCLY